MALPNQSVNLATAETFQSYIREYSDMLITQAFYEPTFSNFATPHAGVKDELVLTSLVVGDLARRFKYAFEPPTNRAEFKPRVLKVQTAKVEMQIIPQAFESTYLGMKRKQGQGMDIPFEGMLMAQILKKLRAEMQYAFWRADAATTAADTDLLKQLFDGILQILPTIGVTPLTTPGGAVTEANILTIVANLTDSILHQYKTGNDLNAFMSPTNGRKFFNAHVSKYQNIKPEYKNEFGLDHYRFEDMKGWIVLEPSLETSNKIIVTPAGNFHYGVDDSADTEIFQFEQNKRAIDFWMDFKFGVQVAIPDAGAIAFNDLD